MAKYIVYYSGYEIIEADDLEEAENEWWVDHIGNNEEITCIEEEAIYT